MLLTNEMPLSLSEAKVRIGKTIWLRNERLKDVRTQNKMLAAGCVTSALDVAETRW